MVGKRKWLGILILVLVFGITVVGCDNGNGSDNNGPKWITVQGEDAEIFTGTLSNSNTIITITNWYDLEWTFTKNGNGGDLLDGVWLDAPYQRMTISGKNWTVAVLDKSDNYRDWVKGTFTKYGMTLTFTPTHVAEEDAGGGSSGGSSGGGGGSGH
jgi:uncharacterized membrane protein YgcG